MSYVKENINDINNIIYTNKDIPHIIKNIKSPKELIEAFKSPKIYPSRIGDHLITLPYLKPMMVYLCMLDPSLREDFVRKVISKARKDNVPLSSLKYFVYHFPNVFKYSLEREYYIGHPLFDAIENKNYKIALFMIKLNEYEHLRTPIGRITPLMHSSRKGLKYVEQYLIHKSSEAFKEAKDSCGKDYHFYNTII